MINGLDLTGVPALPACNDCGLAMLMVLLVLTGIGALMRV